MINHVNLSVFKYYIYAKACMKHYDNKSILR